MSTIPRRALLRGAALLAAVPGISVAARAGEGRDLVVAVPDNLATLDPADANNTLDQAVGRLFLQGLFGFDSQMRIVPVLAESATVNESATEFTFHLRRDIHFHDGEPFDATAVRVNLERIADPANHLKRQSLLSMLDHVELIDRYTVKAVLKTPFGAFLNTVAHPSLALQSPAAIRQVGKDLSRHPVGTGAFTFVSWTPDTVKATRNPNYWKPGWPKIGSVTVRSVPENGTRVAMLQAGEAHYVYPLPTEMVPAISRNSKLEVIDAPSIIPRIVTMNTRRKPFDDARVRQALNYAVDKQALIKVVWSGYADQLDSPAPPLLNFHQTVGTWPHDPAKAKRLLVEAGYPDGFATEIWGNNNTLSVRGMQFLQQQFATVGVNLTVVPMEAGVLSSRVFAVPKPEDAQVQMCYIGPSASTGDADWQFRPLYASDGFPPKMFNIAYYSNPAVDADVRDALLTADAAVRARSYADLQKRVWNDAPAVWLTVDRILDAKARDLHGAYRLPDGGVVLEDSEFV